MKKGIIILIVAVIVAACSMQPANDEKAKQAQLQEYKQQLYDLKQKISALESELALNEKVDVVNVKVAEIAPEHFDHFIEVTGKVEAEQDVDVSPETSGTITDIFVKEGQWVSKGQILAKLSTEVLERSLDELKVALDLATTSYQRQKNLWDQNIGSEMQFLQAKNNKESLEKRIESLKSQMEMADVKSPIDGVVDIVYQKKGHIGGPQMPFAKVINTKAIKVYADISESYLKKVKKGDRVQVYFPALDKTIDARINQIGNTIDPHNRTFRVRINLSNSDNLIKPNLVSIVKIRDYENPEAIVIPSLYIKEDFRGEYTFIVNNETGKNVAQKIYITSGVTDNNRTEVTSGLTSGMKVISEGYNQVVDGTVVEF